MVIALADGSIGAGALIWACFTLAITATRLGIGRDASHWFWPKDQGLGWRKAGSIFVTSALVSLVPAAIVMSVVG